MNYIRKSSISCTALIAFTLTAFCGESVPPIMLPPQIHGNTADIGISTNPPVPKEYKDASYRALPRDTTMILSDALTFEQKYLHISPGDPIVAVLTQEGNQVYYSFPVCVYDSIPGAKYTVELGDGRTTSIWTPAEPQQVKVIYSIPIEGGTFYYLQNTVPFGRQVGGKAFMRVRVNDGK